jgi:spermidine synthase
MACLSRPGDRWTFFEIDPAVVRLARDPDLFTYLRDCRGQFDVEVGDGRLSLARRGNGEFGLIALDAFSSDAIPVHLLTREALEIYVDKLRPHGVIAFHVSNQYLDLGPVLGGLASDAGLACFDQQDQVVTRETLGKYRSRWITMARGSADLGRVSGDPRWKACPSDPGARTWTDDYANVTAALHLR